MTTWEHMSESNEHYTPTYIVEAARETLHGRIDLDPATSLDINRLRVQAMRAHTIRDPGHDREWHGNVFLNPPGGMNDADFRLVIKKSGERPPCVESGACGLEPGHVHQGVDSSAKRWWFKLAAEWCRKRTAAAIFVGFSLEMLQTMQVKTPSGLPTPLDFPLCFPKVRIPYDKLVDDKLVKGASPPHASFIAFLPRTTSDPDVYDSEVERFRSCFKDIGRVVAGEEFLRGL